MENNRNNKKIMISIVVILLLIIIGVLGFVIYKLLHQEEKVTERLPSQGLVVDKEDEEEENPLFTTDMNMLWTFPSGGRTSPDAIIGNSEQNQYDVYFEVYLQDEEETLLYSSPILPIGKRIDKLKLDKALPEGQYSAICTFHMLDTEDHDREVSDVSFNVTLLFLSGEIGE